MSLFVLASAALAAGLFVYLFLALFYPERFQ
jgi:K+-transporting ATPase KdpF subunit